MGVSWGDVKCHTSWEAEGFDVAHAPFSILSSKSSLGNPISCGAGDQWEVKACGKCGRPPCGSLSEPAFSTWEY